MTTTQRADLGDDVWRSLQQAGTPEAFFSSWLRCLLGMAGLAAGTAAAQAVLVWAEEPNVGPFVPVACLPADWLPDALVSGVCEQVLELRLPIQRVEPQTAATVWAAPLLLGADLLGVVAVRCRHGVPRALPECLHWGLGWLAEQATQRHDGAEHPVRERLILTLDLLTRLLDGGRADESAPSIVTELAQRLSCERVSLGFGQLRRVVSSIKMFALSHSAEFSRRIDLISVIEQAMGEAAELGEPVRLRAADAAAPAPLPLREHRRLQRDFDSAFVVSVPFVVQEDVGVFVFEWANPPDDPSVLALAEALAPVVGRAIADYRRLTRPWYRRLANSLSGQWRRLTGPYEGKRKLLAGLAVLLVLAAIFARGEFRIAAPARLEGAVRRVIAAPFDGFVAASQYRAGHVVPAGAVLATLDDRDLRLEGSRWESQEQQYAKQAHDAQAQHNLAQLQISLAQTRQAEAQKRLAETMLERSEIRAPFAGVIVAGDLSQQLGGAVKKGQTLYEIAPLESYRVILDVDEVDMPHVRVGQKGALIVAALPAERFPFVVNLVTPVTEAREGKNYFRVEAEVENPSPHLRPGMEGVAKIDAGTRALVWIWTHRAFDWLRLQSWVWLGI